MLATGAREAIKCDWNSFQFKINGEKSFKWIALGIFLEASHLIKKNLDEHW